MSRTNAPSRQKLEQRNKEIAAAAEAGASLSALTSMYGMSKDGIRNVLRKEGIKLQRQSRPRRGADPRTLDGAKALSTLHRQIGVRLDSWATFEFEGSQTEAALEINMSAMRFGLAKLGAYDYTLTDLQRIAGKLGMPVSELASLTPPPIAEQPKERHG